ncbi:MAG TPA: tetratricopeptide repeat protein [Aggregatilineaceae bacterium]|nr:tetratricopeptide repeat protein [Aggregatilineaceae bacterium]
MSADILQRAIQLLQSGQRDQARALFQQVVQAEPNNEMAWLWLASAAADTFEYQRALQEVLRINPANEQARLQLAQLQPPYARPPAPQPPPGYGYGYGYGGPGYVAPPPMPRQKRGCVGPCLIIVLLFFILPSIFCVGSTLVTDGTLGPLDLIATYFPGDMGRKTVTFETEGHQVSMKVPRSWFPAIENETWWEHMADMLNALVPFEERETDWHDAAVSERDLDDYAELYIVETNPVSLRAGQYLSMLMLDEVSDVENVYIEGYSLNLSSFDCDDVEGQVGDLDVIRLGRLCGIAKDYKEDIEPDDMDGFKDVDVPDALHVVIFYTPIDEYTALEWSIVMPEDQYYYQYEDDIREMIKSVEVN